jgi:hypothetical protein
LKTLRNCVTGAVACIAFGTASLIWRVPLLRGLRKEPGTFERALSAVSVFVIVIGVVYALFAVREYLALREEHRSHEPRPRQRKKRQ